MKIVYADNQIFYNQILEDHQDILPNLLEKLTKINCQTKIISPFHQNIYLKELSPKLKIELTTKLSKIFLQINLTCLLLKFFF